MPRNARYNAAAAAAAAERARVPDARPPMRVAKSRVGANSDGEFREISVHRIVPALWQHRVIFDDQDALVASIEGSGGTPGVGILEPVLVRALTDGRFELIDGERRWRAALEIALRSTRDFMVPARVLDVTPAIAQIMSVTANMHDKPKPIEYARAYAKIRDLLREERGEAATSARAIAAFGWHEKTPVNDYLRIADGILPIVAEATGVDEDAVDYAVLGRYEKGALMKLANMADREARVIALREKLNGAAGQHSRTTLHDMPSCSPEERRIAIATQKPFSIKLREPAEMMSPRDAESLIAQEFSPAMLAMVERAYSGPARPGFLLDSTTDHVVLVVPVELESLTAAQAKRLLDELTPLRKRLSRACRMRRGGATTFAAGATAA